MTTINSQEDFLRALSENPQWKDAVRAQILGDELLQLPVQFYAFEKRFDAFGERFDAFEERFDAFEKRFDAFEERFDAFEKRFDGLEERFDTFEQRMETFVTEQTEFNDRVASFMDRQKDFNDKTDANFARIDRRLDTMSSDIAQVKGAHARSETVQDAAGIAMDMGLEYIRTLPRTELAQMAQKAAGGDIPVNLLRSFRQADLVIEAMDGDSTQYIAVEISFTADQREAGRVLRNAGFLTRFTGCPARAAIASVRNDHSLDQQISSGVLYWHSITQRDIEPE